MIILKYLPFLALVINLLPSCSPSNISADYSQVLRECGPFENNISAKAIKLLTPENEELEPADIARIRVNAKEQISFSISSKGCIQLSEYETANIEVLVADRNWIGHIEPQQNNRPRLSQLNFRNYQKPEFRLICDRKNETYSSGILTVPYSSNLNSSSTTSTTISIWASGPGDEILQRSLKEPFALIDATGDSLGLEASVGGVYRIGYSIVDAMGEQFRSEPLCNIKVLTRSPNISEAIQLQENNLQLAINSVIPIILNDDTEIKVCRQSIEDWTEFSCQNDEDFEKVNSIILSEVGRFRQVLFLEDRAGNRSEKIVQNILVDGSKPRLDIKWQDPTLNDKFSTVRRPRLRYAAVISVQDDLLNQDELRMRQECWVEFKLSSGAPLPGDAATCLSDSCDLETLGAPRSCNDLLEFSIDPDWALLDQATMIVNARVTDYIGQEFQSHTSVRFNLKASISWKIWDDPELKDGVNDIRESQDGTIYVAAYKGLFKLNPGSQKFEAVADLEDSQIRGLHFDRVGRLWLLVSKGFAYLEPDETLVRLTPADIGISGKYFTAIDEDMDGTLWFAGMSAGIASLTTDGQWTDHGNQFVEETSYREYDDIQAIDRDPDGSLRAFGSFGSYLIGDTKWMYESYPIYRGRKGKTSYSRITQVQDGSIFWLQPGRSRIKTANQTWSNATEYQSSHSGFIGLGGWSEGNRQWIVGGKTSNPLNDSRGRQPVVLEIQNQKIQTLYDASAIQIRDKWGDLKLEAFQDIEDFSVSFRDSSGRLWLANDDILISSDGDIDQTIFWDTLPFDSQILSEDRDGSIWVGTRTEGLAIIKDNQIDRLNTRNRRFPFERITHFLRGTNGMIQAIAGGKLVGDSEFKTSLAFRNDDRWTIDKSFNKTIETLSKDFDDYETEIVGLASDENHIFVATRAAGIYVKGSDGFWSSYLKEQSDSEYIFGIRDIQLLNENIIGISHDDGISFLKDGKIIKTYPKFYDGDHIVRYQGRLLVFGSNDGKPPKVYEMSTDSLVEFRIGENGFEKPDSIGKNANGDVWILDEKNLTVLAQDEVISYTARTRPKWLDCNRGESGFLDVNHDLWNIGLETCRIKYNR